jgi:hypothetical protein
MSVRMRHPTLPGQEIDATDGQVPHFEAAGWEKAEGQEGQGETWPAEAQRFEGQEQARIRHPETGGETVVARSAVPFHRERGWEEVKADEPGPAEAEQAAPGSHRGGLVVGEAAATFEGRTVEELREQAKARGVRGYSSMNRAELLGRLADTDTEQEQEAPADAGQTEEGE